MHVYGELTGTLTGSGRLSGLMSAPREISGALIVQRGELSGTLSSSGHLSGYLRASQGISGTLTVPVAVGVIPYTGEVTVTPSEETQVLRTQGKYMAHDVTINPVPSNYGLITWNGSTITVS